MIELTPQYAAGFFDGEGCIHISCERKVPKDGYARHGFHLRVKVDQATKPVIQAFHDEWGGHMRRSQRFRRGRTEVYWHWHMDGLSAHSFLKTVRPYLIVKAAEADLAIKFIEFKKSVSIRSLRARNDKTDFELAMNQMRSMSVEMRKLKLVGKHELVA